MDLEGEMESVWNKLLLDLRLHLCRVGNKMGHASKGSPDPRKRIPQKRS